MDGQSKLAVNRAGKGFRIALVDLFHKFHGGVSGPAKNRWDLTIPTTTKTLIGDLILHQRIIGVRDDGVHPVVCLTLESGKTTLLRLDREVFVTTTTTSPVSALIAGSIVISNGITICVRCKKDSYVIPDGQWAGYCTSCYQQLRPTSQKKRAFVDRDGYIQVLRMKFHPTCCHSGGFKNGDGRYTVAEHRLVVEAALNGLTYEVWCDICIHNRFTAAHTFLDKDVIVHHKNGVRSDNRLENLEQMTASQHAIEHGIAGRFKNLDGGITGRGGRVVFRAVTDKVAAIYPAGERRVFTVAMCKAGLPFIGNGVIVRGL